MPNLPLTGAARMFYRHRFQVKRSSGFYDRGVYVRKDPVLTWHVGNFMPVSQAELDRLPEGSRSDGAVTLYTDACLLTAQAPNQLADRVLFDGVEYEVMTANVWASHNWYTLTKVGQ